MQQEGKSEEHTFGALLRWYRTQAGLTQEQLAERAGLSRRGIADLERGVRRTPYPHTLERLGAALRVSQTDYLALVRAARPANTATTPTEDESRIVDAEAKSATDNQLEAHHNLPLRPTPIIGRRAERASLLELTEAAPLVTLVGPGGVGKTRLALEVANAQIERWPDGVWLVDFAPVADPDLVSQAVATAVGIQELPDQSLFATLLSALAARRLLLVLDNCEHVIDACGRLVDHILHRCPELHVLATSREPLNISGEMTWRVLPLEVPDPDVLPAMELLSHNDAVQLFTQRAREVRREFALTPENVAVVANICHELDGLPLAIELAAARVRVLTPEQISSRLADRFRLLTGGTRTALPRQQTLRALTDWSHDLLLEKERALFRRVSVFAGGWSLESAEAICADETIAESDVLDVLTGLVDKSLVMVDALSDGETRYRLLETLRQYAAERLTESGETSAFLERHAAHYLSRAEDLQALRFVDWHRWRDTAWPWLLLEQDNLRAVLSRCRDGRVDAGAQQGVGLRLSVAMHWFWFVFNWTSEAREWYASMLQITPLHIDRTGFWGAWGAGAVHVGSAESAYWFGRAREIASQLGDEQLLPIAESVMALDAISRRELDEAGEWLARAVSRAGRTGPRWCIPQMLHYAGQVELLAGRQASASRHLDESIRIARELGDDLILANTLGLRADLCLIQADLNGARACLAELDEVSRGLPRLPHFALNTAGRLALSEGDLERARHEFSRVLELTHRTGDAWKMCQSLEGLAAVAAALGDAAAAVTFLASARSVRARVEYRGSPEQSGIDELLAGLRQALSVEQFDAAWRDGEAASVDPRRLVSSYSDARSSSRTEHRG